MRGNETGGKAGFIREARGFTLVELIVVIAILAVLAGVAYPVYTGYIQKANEAADQVLLGAVNEAFASALIDAGYTDGLPADVSVGSYGVINLVKGVLPLDTEVTENLDVTSDSSVDSAFTRYYKGNAEKGFKVFQTLVYNPATRGFSGLYDNKIVTEKYTITKKVDKNGNVKLEVETKDGKKVEFTLQAEDQETFGNSAFGENMTMGELMGEVNNVVSSAGALLGGLGGPSMVEQLLTPELNELLKASGYTIPDPSDYPQGEDDPEYQAALERYMNAGMSAVVMGVAQKSKDLTAAKVLDALQNGGDLGLGSDTSAVVAQAAMVYGVLTGYANSDRGTDIITVDGEEMTVYDYFKQISDGVAGTDPSTPPMMALLQVIGASDVLMNQNSEVFNDYMMNGGGMDDLDGYFAAMRAIDQNTSQLTESGVLDDGFGDADLSVLLDALFGAN